MGDTRRNFDQKIWHINWSGGPTFKPAHQDSGTSGHDGHKVSDDNQVLDKDYKDSDGDHHQDLDEDHEDWTVTITKILTETARI